MDGWMDGWMDALIHPYIPSTPKHALGRVGDVEEAIRVLELLGQRAQEGGGGGHGLGADGEEERLLWGEGEPFADLCVRVCVLHVCVHVGCADCTRG